DQSGPRTGFLVHVDSRGTLLHRRTLPEFGGLSAEAASVLSARASGSAVIFERQTATTSSSAAPDLTFSGPGLTVAALPADTDGRVALAGTTGEIAPTETSPGTFSVTFDDIDGYVALAPSLAALRSR